MISDTFINELNLIRTTLLDSLDNLNKSASFNAVMQSSNIKKEYDFLTNACEMIKRPFEKKFVSAIVGSSTHGKTTIMDEIFPRLSERGWLVTASNDTTSQALRIEFAPQSSELLNEVVVHSWNIKQMKNLFESEYVLKQNNKDNIKVIYGDSSILVDGTESSFAKKDLKKKFKFPLKQLLTPFSHSYKLLTNEFSDESFINALTIKMISSKLRTDPILTIDNIQYNSLHLRAVIKDVCLKDSFDNIKKWTDNISDKEISSLVFIDTPGLATSGSDKDEILKHSLAVKSNQIVLELMKNDELDIIIHLVLCGQQSNFNKLWEALEKNYGNIEMEDLSERIILAINGTNKYFNDKDLKKHVAKEEHFEISVNDNILERMSPRGKLIPAKICFLDSEKVINAFGYLQTYEKFYKKNKNKMMEWLSPNSKSYMFLDNLDLLETFRDNIEAICDPNDRGQGFLIRQVVDLIRKKGPILLIKKYLLRTKLLDSCQGLLKIILYYYNINGDLNYQATKEAMKNCFRFLDEKNFYSIEEFCVRRMDKDINEIIIQEEDSGIDWLKKLFIKICNLLYQRIKEESKVNTETSKIFINFFRRQLLTKWIDDWGYSSSEMPLNERTRLLLQHSLKIHVREILYQFMTSQSLFEGMESLTQTADDKAQIKNIISNLRDAIKKGTDLCDNYGVKKNEYF